MADLDTSISAIDDFMRRWNQIKEYHEKVAKFVEDKCRLSLKNRAVPCIVTSRVKESESLRKKLKDKERVRYSKGKGPYRNSKDIERDIKDLGAVRIALYFPKQKPTVESMITGNFNVQKIKPFSGERDLDESNLAPDEFHWCFPGYAATHYHVHLGEDDLAKNIWDPGIIEIQVASVLRHAWAEVEHNYVYKELACPASVEEKRTIDALGAVIHMGEGFLDQLYDGQRSEATSAEKPFESIYEIGFLVSNWIFAIPGTITGKREQSLGPLPALKSFLEILEMNKRKYLEPIVREIYGDSANFSTATAKFMPFQLTASVYVMDHVLRQEDRKITATQEARVHDNAHFYRLKVMVSTMIWLDELFVPFSELYEKLSKGLTPGQPPELLSWLDSPKVITILQGKNSIKLNGEERQKVDDLWEWFENHSEHIVEFAFKISRLGVLRSFPEDTHLLGRLYVLLSELLH